MDRYGVIGDKAGCRKWRSLYDKLLHEGARDHHTWMLNYFLGMLPLIVVTILNFRSVPWKL